MNAGDGAALGNLYGRWVEYFWESIDEKDLVSRQLSTRGLPPVHYTETPLSVEVDSFGQITGTVERVDADGNREELVLHLYEVEGRLEVGAINDAEAQKLSDRCSEAVSAALSSIEGVQKWEASLPEGINPGGFAEPLKDGHLEMTLGASLPDRMEVIYRAEVDFGYLRLSHYGIPAPVTDETAAKIRTACVKFDPDCEEACRTLGQCTRKGETCIATADSQCEGSAACTQLGRCTARELDGTCIATSSEHCATVSDEYCFGFICQLVGTACTAPPLDEGLAPMPPFE